MMLRPYRWEAQCDQHQVTTKVNTFSVIYIKQDLQLVKCMLEIECVSRAALQVTAVAAILPDLSSGGAGQCRSSPSSPSSLVCACR